MAVEVFGTIAKAAHDRFVRKLSDETARNHVILAMLQKKGRIRYGEDGKQLTWPVRYKRHELETYVDGQKVQFKRINPYLWATVDWRAYDMNTVVTKFEVLTTKGESALFRLYGQKTRELKDDFRRELAGKFFQDGSDGKNFIGIEGIMSGTYAAGSKLGTPNGTYAGLDQTEGTYGGSSIADVEYSFWSPTLVNYGSSAWAASGQTFADTGLEAVRYGILRTMRRNAVGERIDYVDLHLDMYNDFMELYSGKENLYVNKGSRNGPLAQLGFETLEYDGVEITWEEDVPADTGYGINCNYVDLCLLSDTLVDGSVEYDIDSKGWKLDADIFGQFKFKSPQHQFKLYSSEV